MAGTFAQLAVSQRVSPCQLGVFSLPTLSTLSKGGEAPAVLAIARHRGACFPHPAPHIPQQHRRCPVPGKSALEKIPQRGELVGVVSHSEQTQHAGELVRGHGGTVRRPRHLGVTCAGLNRMFTQGIRRAPAPPVPLDGTPGGTRALRNTREGVETSTPTGSTNRDYLGKNRRQPVRARGTDGEEFSAGNCAAGRAALTVSGSYRFFPGPVLGVTREGQRSASGTAWARDFNSTLLAEPEHDASNVLAKPEQRASPRALAREETEKNKQRAGKSAPWMGAVGPVWRGQILAGNCVRFSVDSPVITPAPSSPGVLA